MRSSPLERLGPLVREGEGESTYICNVCGKPKLYLNQDKRTWFCFVCEEGGVIRHGIHTTVGIRVQRETEAPRLTAGVLGIPEGSREARWLHDRNAPSWLYNRLYHHTSNGIGIPLSLGGTMVGMQWYNPEKEVRYWNEGQRGLYRVGIRGPVLVFEGFFDLASVWSRLAYCAGDYRLVFTAGNHLDVTQRTEIVERCGKEKLYLCMDNDKLRPLVQLLTAFSFHVDTHLLCPPPQYKDWDEALTQDPTTIKLIEGVL